MALAAYRHVLRSTRIAFQGVTLIPPRLSTQTRYYGIPTKSRYLGDLRTFDAARIEARKGFEKNRQLSSGGEEATQEIRQAEDVAKILRENIVQGQGDAAEEDHYKLRIHEETERGDNDSVKEARKRPRSLGGARCGS